MPVSAPSRKQQQNGDSDSAARKPPGPKIDDFKILSKLGEGTFSEVLKVKHKVSGKVSAMKRFKKNFQSSAEIEGLREIQALRRLNPHRHIIDLEDVIFESRQGLLCLNFELMECNLYELISKKLQAISEVRCKYYLHQILEGLNYIHSKGIFHRDIKPENILIKNNDVKIADLGSCRGTNSRQPYTEYIATRWYRSPEVLICDGIYTSKMDVWAVGCVLYEMFTKQPLFPGSNELDQIHRIHNVLGTPPPTLLEKLLGSKIPTKFQFPAKAGVGLPSLLISASDSFIAMNSLLLTYDPDKRPTAAESLRHPLLKGVHLIRLIGSTEELVESDSATEESATDGSNESDANSTDAQGKVRIEDGSMLLKVQVLSEERTGSTTADDVRRSGEEELPTPNHKNEANVGRIQDDAQEPLHQSQGDADETGHNGLPEHSQLANTLAKAGTKSSPPSLAKRNATTGDRHARPSKVLTLESASDVLRTEVAGKLPPNDITKSPSGGKHKNAHHSTIQSLPPLQHPTTIHNLSDLEEQHTSKFVAHHSDNAAESHSTRKPAEGSQASTLPTQNQQQTPLGETLPALNQYPRVRLVVGKPPEIEPPPFAIGAVPQPYHIKKTFHLDGPHTHTQSTVPQRANGKRLSVPPNVGPGPHPHLHAAAVGPAWARLPEYGESDSDDDDERAPQHAERRRPPPTKPPDAAGARTDRVPPPQGKPAGAAATSLASTTAAATATTFPRLAPEAKPVGHPPASLQHHPALRAAAAEGRMGAAAAAAVASSSSLLPPLPGKQASGEPGLAAVVAAGSLQPVHVRRPAPAGAGAGAGAGHPVGAAYAAPSNGRRERLGGMVQARGWVAGNPSRAAAGAVGVGGSQRYRGGVRAGLEAKRVRVGRGGSSGSSGGGGGWSSRSGSGRSWRRRREGAARTSHETYWQQISLGGLGVLGKSQAEGKLPAVRPGPARNVVRVPPQPYARTHNRGPKVPVQLPGISHYPLYPHNEKKS